MTARAYWKVEPPAALPQTAEITIRMGDKTWPDWTDAQVKRGVSPIKEGRL